MTVLYIDDKITELEQQIATISDTDKEHVGLRLRRLIAAAEPRPVASKTISSEDMLSEDDDLLFDNVPV